MTALSMFRVLLLASLGVWQRVVAQNAGDTCDMCFFLPNDPSDCRVYGKIDGDWVSWTRASRDCLDSYNIRITGVDPFAADCDPPSANTFVNSGIRGGVLPNSVLGGLGVAEGGFFEQQSSGMYVLKDSITVDGQTISCETSQSDCYNAMRSYFADGAAGGPERRDVCDTVLNAVARDLEQEQSNVRIRICQDFNDSTPPPLTDCGALVTEVDQAMQDHPDKDCSGFAFGPGTDLPEACEGEGPNNSSTPSPSSSVSRTIALSRIVVITASLSLVLARLV